MSGWKFGEHIDTQPIQDAADDALNTASKVAEEAVTGGLDDLKQWFKDFDLKEILLSFPLIGPALAKIWNETTKGTDDFNRDISLDKFEELELTNFTELAKQGVEGLKKLAKNIAEKYSIPKDIFVHLIDRESGFDVNAKNPESSAQNLSQMIDGTWKTYGKGLDRNNPTHQLVAAARYLEFIKRNNNCTWEEATAFYNTGENFDHKSNELVGYDYLKGNLQSIAWKIPGAKPKSARELAPVITKAQYFKGAAAYYSGKDYDEIA